MLLSLFSFLTFFISVIPYLLDDTRRVMENWGTSGKFDPFDNVYEVSLTIHRLFTPILTIIHIRSSYSNLPYAVCRVPKFQTILRLSHASKNSTIH